jgi:type VI secretion system protein ImpM
MTPATGAFVFGKLPAHGDFVARGLSASAHEAWDAFLSGSLADARSIFGDTFEARFDSAPAWRFALPDTAGAIAPSVDRAGRRFPLMLGSARTDETDGGGIASACEDLLYRALSESMTVDTLWDAIGALEPAASDDSTASGWWVDGGAEAGIAPLTDPRPRDLISRMLSVTESVS